MNVSIGGIAKTVEITSFDKLGDVKVCMLTTTADGSVGFQQLNQEVIDTIYASFPVDTASGEIASFEDGADNVPVRELKLTLEPYQNLNGYDSPWVGGAGKNLYNSKGLNAYTNSGITATESNGTLTLNGTATANAFFSILNTGYPSGTYTWSFNNSAVNDGVRISFRNTGGTYWAEYRADAVNKTCTVTGEPDDLLFYVYSGTTVTNFTVKPQFEVGTTATAWTPYENICPIYPNNGKNLFDESLLDTDTSTVVYTSYSVPNGTYTMSSEDFPFDANVSNVFFLAGSVSTGANTTNNGVYKNRPRTITVTDGHYTVAYRSTGANTNNPKNFKFQIEHGNIATEYVPYNGIGITRTGKNLLNTPTITVGSTTFTQGADGSITASPNNSDGRPWSYANTQYRTTLPAGSYKLVIQTITATSVSYRQLEVYTSDGTLVFNTGNSVFGSVGIKTVAFTLSESTSIGVMAKQYDAVYKLMIINSTDDTSYEPYTAERYYPISDNPVYGGTLEVETGVLTVTHKFIDLGDYTWKKSNDAECYIDTINDFKQVSVGSNPNVHYGSAISSAYKFKETTTLSDGEFVLFYNSAYAGYRLFVHDNFTGMSVAQVKTYMTGVKVVYLLATPVQYQLTPTQVKTLLGYNNIWTDSGTVEVQYRANIGLYIQKIIGSSEDDMVANQNISADKYFFVGETLYLSTSAISAGQTIVVGTNCIKTNLADALNALNS